MLQLTDTGMQIAILVMLFETVMMAIILLGWYYGARRLDLKLHHRAVYSMVFVHLVGVTLWMIPRALSISSEVFENPGTYWYLIVHNILGFVALSMGIVLSLLFILKPDMPLSLLRRARPAMILVLIVWSVAFILGAWAFLTRMTGLLP